PTTIAATPTVPMGNCMLDAATPSAVLAFAATVPVTRATGTRVKTTLSRTSPATAKATRLRTGAPPALVPSCNPRLGVFRPGNPTVRAAELAQSVRGGRVAPRLCARSLGSGDPLLTRGDPAVALCAVDQHRHRVAQRLRRLTYMGCSS